MESVSRSAPARPSASSSQSSPSNSSSSSKSRPSSYSSSFSMGVPLVVGDYGPILRTPLLRGPREAQGPYCLRVDVLAEPVVGQLGADARGARLLEHVATGGGEL